MYPEPQKSSDTFSRVKVARVGRRKFILRTFCFMCVTTYHGARKGVYSSNFLVEFENFGDAEVDLYRSVNFVCVVFQSLPFRLLNFQKCIGRN